jgi:hypothetical protein
MSFGFGDGGSSIADIITRLVTSPRVRYLGDQLQRQLPQVSGPFTGSQLNRNAGSQNTGASPNYTAMGQSMGQAAGSIASLLSGGSQGGQQQQQDPLMALYSKLINHLKQFFIHR